MLLLASSFDLQTERWPLPANLRQADEQLKGLRHELQVLEKEKAKREAAIAELQAATQPMWTRVSRMPAVEVQAELETVARSAKVTIQNVGAPRSSKITDNVTAVELTLRIVGPMRDISRFLQELERDQPPFFWSSCALRPDNPREPHAVVLDGQIRAYVLGAEAISFLFPQKGGDTP